MVKIARARRPRTRYRWDSGPPPAVFPRWLLRDRVFDFVIRGAFCV